MQGSNAKKLNVPFLCVKKSGEEDKAAGRAEFDDGTTLRFLTMFCRRLATDNFRSLRGRFRDHFAKRTY